jgi:hypothetical protein
VDVVSNVLFYLQGALNALILVSVSARERTAVRFAFIECKESGMRCFDEQGERTGVHNLMMPEGPILAALDASGRAMV